MPRPPNPEVRTRLLFIGRTLVHSRGFNGSGIQDITGAAQVPKGSFYNYFASKESFVADIIEEYWQSIEHRHGPLLYDARLKPLIRVEKFFAALSQDHAKQGFTLGCLIGNLSLELANTSGETRLKLIEVVGKWEQALAACVREAQERNELDGDANPIQLAAMMIEAYEGAVMRGKLDRNSDALDRFSKIALPKLIR